jgi:hypothetical protein
MAFRHECRRLLKQRRENAFLRVKRLKLAQVGHLLDASLDTKLASLYQRYLLDK